MDSGGHRIGKISMARSEEVVSVSFQLPVKKPGAHFRREVPSGIGCAGSCRILRNGSFDRHFPRHFVPGYDRDVPLGHK
jgi:hypothetical protein